MCVKGWYYRLSLLVETGSSVLYTNGLGETLSYNGLSEIGLSSFKSGSLLVGLSAGSIAVNSILLLTQGCRRFNQYNLQDRMLQLNSNPTLYWGG